MNKQQSIISGVFILVGVLFAGLNFYVFNQISNGGLSFDLDKVKNIGQNTQAKAVLPDVNPGESYTKSKLRDAEIGKIKNSLPYTNSRFSILYSDSSKYLTVTINAKSIEQYRENKFLAEEKLLYFGAQETCLLEVVWNVPIGLKDKTNSQDYTTRGCSS